MGKRRWRGGGANDDAPSGRRKLGMLLCRGHAADTTQNRSAHKTGCLVCNVSFIFALILVELATYMKNTFNISHHNILLKTITAGCAMIAAHLLLINGSAQTYTFDQQAMGQLYETCYDGGGNAYKQYWPSNSSWLQSVQMSGNCDNTAPNCRPAEQLESGTASRSLSRWPRCCRRRCGFGKYLYRRWKCHAQQSDVKNQRQFGHWHK